MSREVSSRETALQHTRCWLAVTAIHANLDRFMAEGTGELERKIVKIRRWLSECEDDIRKKKISASAHREIGAACERMADTMLPPPDVKADGEALFVNWCASMWASLTLLEDCRNACPAWFKGRHWRYLLQTTTTLADAISRECPGADEQGTAMYEAVVM